VVRTLVLRLAAAAFLVGWAGGCNPHKDQVPTEVDPELVKQGRQEKAHAPKQKPAPEAAK
jgi:hypothetical protein